MSSYLPSLKWPSLTFQTSAPAPDAPLGSLSAEEQAQLDELTDLALPLLQSPAHPLPEDDGWSTLHSEAERESLQEMLLRLLRYNASDVAKSVRQLKDTLQWRSTSQVALQPKSAIHGLKNGFPLALLDSKGKDGERIIFTAAEQYLKKDVDHRVQLVGVGKLFDYMMYDKGGPRIKQCHVIVDYMGLTIKNVDLIALKNGIPIYLSHFPDVFAKVICINYPKFIYGVWKVIRPLLDERTANRVIWIADNEALREELESSFPRDEIPHWLGGPLPADDSGKELELFNGVVVDTDVLKARFT